MLLHLFVVYCAVYSTTAAHCPLEELEDPFAVIETRDDSVNYRLPTSLKPINYVITLEPFIEPQFTFDGHIVIEIQVVEDTSNITLHGNMLIVLQENIHVRLEKNVEDIVINSLNYDNTTMFYTIGLAQVLKAGSTINVEITYTGILNEENNGFYRASYEEDGVTKWFATTHFAPCHARQAFPCFDEPALKATFHIFIIRPESYNSISNMELVETVALGSGRFRDGFRPSSFKMSTYLVAFVVSEMTAEKLENQVVYAPRDLIDDGRGKFAVETGIEVIKAVENFTGIEYSLNKMFQVSIPDKDLSPGAMANWGLVTYKQRYLMYSEEKTTAAEKETIVKTIAHEFGHQWFGNLVSPSSWEYIWLNEGFATYFEYYAASIAIPAMRMMDQFVIETLQCAFESDGLETTRPMSHPAVTPAEISSLFHKVAYDKSSSVIRMMEHFLTQAVFRRGLRYYLEYKRFDAASPIDLWDAMQQAVIEIRPDLYLPSTIEQIMETWTSQAGYPVVTVGRTLTGFLTFTQTRFLLNKATHDDTSIWTIPISVATKMETSTFYNTTPLFWLRAHNKESNIQVGQNDVVVLNIQQTGYYRVNYDEDLWNLIINFINTDDYFKIHWLNRAQLIDDAFALARSGRIAYEIPMRLSTYLIREGDLAPFFSFVRALTFLDNHLSGSGSYELFKRFVRDFLGRAYNRQGTLNDHLRAKIDININYWLCKFDHTDCLKSTHIAVQFHPTWALNKPLTYSPIHPDRQEYVYCGTMRSVGEYKWQLLYQWYHSDVIEDLERNRVLSAFGCASKRAYLNRLLSMFADQDDDFKLRPEDRTAAFTAIYTHSAIGLDIAFTYVIENFAYLKSALTTAEIQTIFSDIASRVTTSKKLTELMRFADAQNTEDQNIYGSTFSSAISRIRANFEWSRKYVRSIEFFLQDYYNPKTTTKSTTKPTTKESTEPTTDGSTEYTTPSLETTTPDGAVFRLASVPLLVGAMIFNMLA